MRPYVIVLGIAQDGGYPQAGCEKACCVPAWRDPALRRGVSCLGIVDPSSGQRWMIDATPDFRDQLQLLNESTTAASQPSSRPAIASRPSPQLDGIFLTHAHIGHYTGLMNLGREVMGTTAVPIYCMPRMQHFLINNGPWDQLVTLNNISLRTLRDRETTKLGREVNVAPIPVVHRDEYSETVGYFIGSDRRRVMYIPDIDHLDPRWLTGFMTLLTAMDVAYLDGTFYDGTELPGRDLREIPHPLIVDTMRDLRGLQAADRAKIHFIHLNHTNPALRPKSDARKAIEKAGFHVAEVDERFEL